MADKKANPKDAVKRSVLDRMLQLVLESVLLRVGIPDFLEQIRKEFREQLQEAGYSLSLTTFKEWLDEVIWNLQGNEKDLIDMMKGRVTNPVEEYHRLHPHIPVEFIKPKVRRLRGLISAPKRPKFVRGILHIEFPDDLKIRELSTHGFSKPFTIPKVPGYNGPGVVANGTNLGILHTPIIAENIIRLAFWHAEEIKNRCFIIPGGMFELDTKKAGGPLKALRALSLGRNVNPNIFNPSYQEKALHILEKQPWDAMVYENLAEALANLLSGWHKAAFRPKDDSKTTTRSIKEKPEYNGPVYVIFGRSEEDLILAIAYWRMLYYTRVEQNRLEARIRVAKNAVVHLLKQLDKEFARRPKDQDAKYTKTLAKKIEDAEMLQNALIMEHTKTRITNSSVEDFQRFVKLAYSYVAQEIESALPHCRVIGSSSQVCVYDDKTIEFHIPSHDRVTPTLLSDYAKSSGPKVLRHTMADHVIICHPRAIYPNGTAREADRDGMRGYARVTTAPICIDSSYYRESTDFIVRKDAHPVSRVVYDERHVPGILHFGVDNNTVYADPVSVDVLFMRKRMKENDQRRRRVIVPSRYMWGMVATDQHWGGPSKCFVSKPNVNGIRQRFGMNEAVFEMLRTAGLVSPEKMPVQFWWAMDDLTQGRHFENQNQPHHHLIPYYTMEELFTEAYNHATSFECAKQQIQKMADIVLYQLERMGPIWTHEQMETVIVRHLKPNADVFSAIAGSAMRAGLRVKGISHYAKLLETAVVSDSRDVGLVVHGTGNHFLNTVRKEIMEGPLYSFHLRSLLAARPEWAGKEAFLEKHVISPRYGNQMIAYGTYQVGDGYEYAIELRDTPTRMSGWGDTLLGHVANDLQRGNYARFLDGKLKVTAVGDKHFFSFSRVPWAFYLMGPASTETDVYGERGFPPNNTGVVFLGLPEKGPEHAEILVRPLFYPTIRSFLETGKNIDWKTFLPNPV